MTMAARRSFEFDCPQFFDFCNEVENNTAEIHCLGGDSPGFENKFHFKSKNPVKNRLTAWNDKLSTPVNKSPFVNVYRSKNHTDSEKLNEKKRLSKSEGSLNIVGVYANKFKKQDSYYPVLNRKKSISEGDIRLKRKFPVTPKRIPATPMCLKRTVNKGKTKKLKTTEELELEKIAELQSLTLKHLRLNEMNMMKLKLKPKQPTVTKLAPSKDVKREKSALQKQFQKDLDAVIKRLNSNKNMRFGFSTQARPTMDRLGAVSRLDGEELVHSNYTLQPPLTSLLNGVQTVVDEKDIINELSFKKNPGHSGLFFHLNNSKRAALKPFNFNDRVKDSGPDVLSKSSVKVKKENEMETKAKFSHSFHASRLRNHGEKENFYMKTAPKTDTCITKKSFKF